MERDDEVHAEVGLNVGMGLTASGIPNGNAGSSHIDILPVGVEIIGSLAGIPCSGIVVITATGIRVERHAG